MAKNKKIRMKRAQGIRDNAQEVIDYLTTPGKSKAMLARKLKTSQTVIDSALIAGGRPDLASPTMVERYRNYIPSQKVAKEDKFNKFLSDLSDLIIMYS